MSELQTIDTQALLMQGMTSNADAAVMKDLYSLSKEIKADQAKELFFTALAMFQSKCPIIEKTKKVYNKDGKTVRYKYAPLDSIVKQVAPILESVGLSYIFKAETVEGGIIQHCEIYHTAGHKEISSFGSSIDVDAYMGDAQKAGSASTFAKRYAFCNGLGILTGDQDDDGQSLGGAESPQILYKRFTAHMDALMNNIGSVLAIRDGIAVNDLESASEAWFELDDETKKDLWVAVTKGSCFTKTEKDMIKSRAFRKAHYPDLEDINEES